MIKRTITGLALTAVLFLALWGGGLWFAVPCMITTCGTRSRLTASMAFVRRLS